MPARTGETGLGGCEANDTTGHSHGRMRSEPYHDASDQVRRLRGSVEWSDLVDGGEFTVNEVRHSDQVVSYVLWKNHVLGLDLQDLVRSRQRFADEVLFISQLREGTYVGLDVSGSEVS